MVLEQVKFEVGDNEERHDRESQIARGIEPLGKSSRRLGTKRDLMVAQVVVMQ